MKFMRQINDIIEAMETELGNNHWDFGIFLLSSNANGFRHPIMRVVNLVIQADPSELDLINPGKCRSMKLHGMNSSGRLHT
jgi:hypothetical protein